MESYEFAWDSIFSCVTVNKNSFKNIWLDYLGFEACRSYSLMTFLWRVSRPQNVLLIWYTIAIYWSSIYSWSNEALLILWFFPILYAKLPRVLSLDRELRALQILFQRRDRNKAVKWFLAIWQCSTNFLIEAGPDGVIHWKSSEHIVLYVLWVKFMIQK